MKIKLDNKAFNVSLENIAADKSISHRCAIFSLLCEESSYVKNYLFAQDCMHTLEIIKQLGAVVENENGVLKITPPKQIKIPDSILECGNSGTLMRLMIGFLSCIDGVFVLSGDKYLNARPMKRVSALLNKLGANIYGRDDANLAPLFIKGSKLDYFEYDNVLKSAQVKSALILAALFSKGCIINEDEKTRDHSENLLKLMQAPIKIDGNKIIVEALNDKKLKAFNVTVPNDPSSAFFYAVLCAISKDSTLVLKNMLLNKTRIEAYKVLEKMGANIKYELCEEGAEQIGTITIKSAPLKAVCVDENISWLIDEIPALSIAFAYAKGTSIVKNAKELRVKESDRIKAILYNLNSLGFETNEFEDGFSVLGFSSTKKESLINTFGDHRIAMSFSLLARDFDIKIDDVECVKSSFVNFYDILKEFGAKYAD
ncbi:3-phosphoshikimate 1-carboxyvinyltransferase [Campylobacter canadensis]|uniref:3-phosphoshikimate 1-carboxyvinyltransferase n=1 Tax=Campylobacter canadensis TaxID=449520 RepID=A0ABS7WRA8_9BACT|nr:3-phosphoshikimate 1-carboxyvinyltransferase [Campylobacter canadensis]MBZ7987281.1 3-phosphoshikimate 1-carboxyvinyltransferase [Campylobacter canadensis]MBZ7998290.1 3-phosphoshikimate 1-carboxyvinyltransferase [Campylobacter canadensis]